MNCKRLEDSAGVSRQITDDGMMQSYSPVQSSERPGPTLVQNVHYRIDATRDPVEGFRKVIPPPNDRKHNGPSVPETEPYILTHLIGVARRLNVTTKAECVALLLYLKDEDAKLRYIAMRALARKVNAFPAGASAEAFADKKSDEHRKMVLRYAELVTRLAD